MKRLSTFLLALMLITLGANAQTVIHECVAEIDDWSIEGNTNGDFHYNDWSVEADASGMVVPFLEYWVWSGEGNLSAATISHEQLTELNAGYYEVSMDIRIFSEAGNEIGSGTTFKANSVSEDLDTGSDGVEGVYGDETEVYGTYTLLVEITATDVTNGTNTLDISITIPENATYNWISFKNLKVTYLGETAVGYETHECTAASDHWTTTGTTGIAYNTWSVEDDPSGMVAPYLQLWVWGLDATQPSLEAATVSHETLTDLTAGYYEVSMAIRIYSEVGNEIGEGTTFNANDASADIVLEGSEATNSTDDYENETLVYGTYHLIAYVDEDGKLDISITIPEGVDYNWIAWKNLSVTYLGEDEPEAVDGNDNDYEEGDEIEMLNFKGTVASGNLFVNGGFNNGVEGWTAGNTYTSALSEANVTINKTGGYNGGQYVTLNASGAADSKTPTQAIAVEPGKSYLLVGYTMYSGSNLPDSRYSALFIMDSETAERSHLEGTTSYSDGLVELQFVNNGEWVKTEGVFTVPAENEDGTFSYVGMRMNWSTASYDGLQLYELEGKFSFPEDADYAIGDEVTIDDVTYTVVSDNLVENGSFNDRTTGWTYGNGHAEALYPYNVLYSTDGGYNDGPYITSRGGGSSANTTPSKEVGVKTGKTYLFVGYTNGTAPDSGNTKYNGLFTMSSETAESGDATIQMNWGDPDEALNGWTKTEAVFTAETDYVGLRFAWCPGACLDGFQIYQIAESEDIEWTMTEAGWGTMILPFDADVPSGLTLYAGDALELSSDGTTITVGTEATSIAANTPYLVNGTAGEYTFTGAPTNTEDSYTVGLLTGTLVNMSYSDFTANGTEYVLQNHVDESGEGEGLAFYPIIADESTDVTLNAYHCYLTSDVTPLALHLPGTATAIEAVESEVIANGAIYDLSGRRVAKAVKGVYIQNGKKVLVK